MKLQHMGQVRILPGDTITCGRTVAEIDNEMPFTQLDIYYSNDSLHCENETEIKEMFGKNFFGNPYLVELE